MTRFIVTEGDLQPKTDFTDRAVLDAKPKNLRLTFIQQIRARLTSNSENRLSERVFLHHPVDGRAGQHLRVQLGTRCYGVSYWTPAIGGGVDQEGPIKGKCEGGRGRASTRLAIYENKLTRG